MDEERSDKTRTEFGGASFREDARSAEHRRARVDMPSVDARISHDGEQRERAGGVAALYAALALLAAIPYFLLVVDYPGADTAADKVALVVRNYGSMYPMYFATYVLFGIALGVLALALWNGLQAKAPFTAHVATAIGLMWSFALVISGMVFMYGMTTIKALAETDQAQAAVTWQSLEPVALALGGAGGELLGGLWILLVSTIVLRNGGLPNVLAWLGIVIGVVGLTSTVPALHDAAIVFGLLQIVWFAWVGISMLRPHGALRSRTSHLPHAA